MLPVMGKINLVPADFWVSNIWSDGTFAFRLLQATAASQLQLYLGFGLSESTISLCPPHHYI